MRWVAASAASTCGEQEGQYSDNRVAIWPHSRIPLVTQRVILPMRVPPHKEMGTFLISDVT
jgi:hypothetical protein